jgi:hypothetical protein
MTPMRDTATGAAPEVAMAELNSDMHHLEQGFKEHRIETAKRHAEERTFREAMTLAHATTAANVARLDDKTKALGEIADDHTRVLFELRGAVKIVGAIAAGVPLLLEVWRHIHP